MEGPGFAPFLLADRRGDVVRPRGSPSGERPPGAAMLRVQARGEACVGSCATLWALDAGRFQELLERPEPEGVSDDEELRARAEVVPLEACAVAEWNDLADNDLSRIAQGEAFDGLPAERAAEVLGRPEVAQEHAGKHVFPGWVMKGAEREALEALGGLLGIEPRQPERVPWWVRARWSEPGDGFWIGLLAPDQVRALRDAVRATKVFDTLRAWDAAASRGTYRAETYETLAAFLDRAADAGCWVLGVEGQS